MKKVLVLSLVLVMALASSAFAAVNFSGDFTATIENNGESFSSDLKVDNKFTVNIKASSESENNWSFSAESSLNSTEFKLGKYKLELNDDYFDLYFWGNGQKLSDKGSRLGLIKAGEEATGTTNRARLVVDAIEPVTLTTDFTNNALYVFADADVIENVTAGIAYRRAGASVMSENATNTIGVYGKGTVDMFTIEGDVAATLGEEIALGYGAKVTVKPMDQLSASVSYLGTAEGFVGEPDANISKVDASVTYTETDYRVKTTLAYDLKADDDPVTVTAEARYRFGQTLGFDDLFKSDKYYTNDAPAVGVSTKIAKGGLDNVTLEVASPVVEDMIWARGLAKYVPSGDNHNFEVGAFGYIKATEKLTVEPSVEYKTDGNVVTLKGAAGYKIGASDTTLKLEVAKNFYEEGAEVKPVELIKASVKVSF